METNIESKTSGRFTSKLGFVLAAAGSAVGLGNIWRFPYLAAKHGGGIFLITYLVIVLTFGYALMISENAIGRMTGKGPIGSYRDLCEGKSPILRSIRFGGLINSIVPLIITPYYCVIGGWVTKYLIMFCTTPIETFSKDNPGYSAGYFTSFITGTWEPLLYFFLFAAILVVVVALGVEKGIERFNKILMPLLVVMIIAICVYCCFLPNAETGLYYYLKPDMSKFSYMTIVAAMGQVFFSLSLSMGIAITYGSYMRKEDDLISSVNQVELFDTTIAFLAGFMIIPAVVSFGGKEAAEAAGPGLVFITMPQVFANFWGGQIIGILFFVLVLFAAATSAISLLETNVQTLSQEFKISRKAAIIVGLGEIIVIGVVTVLGYSVLSHIHPLAFIEQYAKYDILDSLDFLSNSVLMPIAGIFTTLLVVAVIGIDKITSEIKGTNKWYRQWTYQFCMCVVVIPCLLIVLLSSVGLIK